MSFWVRWPSGRRHACLQRVDTARDAASETSRLGSSLSGGGGGCGGRHRGCCSLCGNGRRRCNWCNCSHGLLGNHAGSGSLGNGRGGLGLIAQGFVDALLQAFLVGQGSIHLLRQRPETTRSVSNSSEGPNPKKHLPTARNTHLLGGCVHCRRGDASLGSGLQPRGEGQVSKSASRWANPHTAKTSNRYRRLVQIRAGKGKGHALTHRLHAGGDLGLVCRHGIDGLVDGLLGNNERAGTVW